MLCAALAFASLVLAALPSAPRAAGAGEDESVEPHWSFRPLRRPAVPTSDATHPVDAFLDAARAAAGIAATPPADPRTFARRAYLDVIGLPPTPEEVAAYVAEAARDEVGARAALIERLLASPRHGERWARHWLDVVRFAESDGFETNQPRPNAWPYRDYVIRAFNEDLPFPRFVREQLAGDQLGADEATGFLVGGPWDRVKSPDPVLTANQRADELHDMVATTGSAFLGLTVGCARCHDHKFDPITQRDYTALVAVFAGVQHGERPLAKLREERAAELAALEPELARLERALEDAEPLADPASSSPRRAPVSSKRNSERFAPRLATALRFEIERTNSGSEPCLDELELFDAEGWNHARAARVASSGDYAGDPQHRLEHLCDGIVGNAKSWISNTPGRGWVELELAAPAVVERVVWGRDREARFADRTALDYRLSLRDDAGAWSEVASARDRASEAMPLAGPLEELARAQRELHARVTALRAVPQVYAGRFEAPPPTQLCHRGDPMQPRERIAPGGIRALAGFELAEEAPEAERRAALAEWIAARENPLPARVIANRLWHYHFGTGLVATPSDFGRNGSRPAHPELLDWLACELLDHGGSLKHLHRLMLTSAAYARSSRIDDLAYARDGSNRLLWRFAPRRLEAEAMRDALLQVSGELDLRMGGPGFDLFEPNDNYVKVYRTKERALPGDLRRMVYQAKPRSELDTLFGVFDCPDAGQIQPQRNASTTPLQALALWNSSFILERAGAFASRVRRELAERNASGSAAEVQRAYALAFARSPEPEEERAALALVEQHGLPALARVLLNSNEFVFLP